MLARLTHGAGQLQIGQIDAADQEHASDRNQQEEERAADRARDFFREWLHYRTQMQAQPVRLGFCLLQAIQFGLRSGNRDSWPKPRKREVVVVTGCLGQPFGRDDHRHVHAVGHLVRRPLARPEVDRGKAEACRQHPDDRLRRSIDAQRPAYGRRVAVEQCLERVPAQNHLRVAPLRELGRQELPAENWRYT